MTTESAAMTPSDSPAPGSTAPASPVSRSLGWLAVGVLLFLWAYADWRLGPLWYISENYSYGWYVPLLCLISFWERWQRRPEPERVPATTGPVIVWGMLALMLLPSCLLLEVIPYSRFTGWPFAGIVIGITFCALYLLGGRRWVNHFAFPVFFFLIAIPWPSRIELPLIRNLSLLNAALSTWITNILGTPAIRYGLVIQTGSGTAGVEEACSGIRSLQASIMVSLFLGELFSYGFFRRIFFLLSGIGLAFVCNVVRTTYLVRICDLKGEAGVQGVHDTAGYAILGVTLAGLLLLAWFFRRKKGSRSRRSPAAEDSEGEEEGRIRTKRSEERSREEQGDEAISESDEEPSPRPSRRRLKAKLTGALVGSIVWILAVELGIESWFGSKATPMPERAKWSFQVSVQQSEYHEPPIREGVRDVLKYDEGKRMAWQDIGGHAWQAYCLRWLPAQTKYRAVEAAAGSRLHEPVVCLTGAGMICDKNFGEQVREVNGLTLLTKRQRFVDKGRPLHLLYVYWDSDVTALENRPANRPSTASALKTALHAVRIRDRGRNEKSVIIVGVWGMETDEAAEAALWQLLEKAIRT